MREVWRSFGVFTGRDVYVAHRKRMVDVVADSEVLPGWRELNCTEAAEKRRQHNSTEEYEGLDSQVSASKPHHGSIGMVSVI